MVISVYCPVPTIFLLSRVDVVAAQMMVVRESAVLWGTQLDVCEREGQRGSERPREREGGRGKRKREKEREEEKSNRIGS